MAEHISSQLIEQLAKHKMRAAEALEINEHLSACSSCFARFSHEYAEHNGYTPSVTALGFSFVSMVDAHIRYDMKLVAFLSGTLKDPHRENLLLHLECCEECARIVAEMRTFVDIPDKDKVSAENAVVGVATLQPDGYLPTRSERFSFLLRFPSQWFPEQWVSAAVIVVCLLAAATLTLINYTEWQIQLGQNRQIQAPALIPESSRTTIPQTTTAAEPRASQTNKGPDGVESVPRTPQLRRSTLPPSSSASTITQSEKLVRDGHQGGEAELIASLRMPDDIKRLDDLFIATRGSGNHQESISIVSPIMTAVKSPLFRWTALPGATYTVTVYDADLNEVKTSEPLTANEWRMPPQFERRLQGGMVYTWKVTALKDGKLYSAPAPPSRAEFIIIKRSVLNSLDRRIKQTDSPLVRAARYAEVGLLEEAEHELRTRLALHPTDHHAKQLLEKIISWRGTNPYEPAPTTTKPAQ